MSRWTEKSAPASKAAIVDQSLKIFDYENLDNFNSLERHKNVISVTPDQGAAFW